MPVPRVVVATQVIEAGVDLSADVLFTEACPWPSLVQRLGRLARRGGTGDATVIALDLPKAAPPYEEADIEATWTALVSLSDGSPRALQAFEDSDENRQLVAGLYPYDPQHLLLREELDELFDTTPDLTGADLDVSRYIRSGDERDVSVFWVQSAPGTGGRVDAPDRKLRPVRDGLCAVPFLRARDWLCGKAQAASEPKRLADGVNAWVWDYLDGRWRRAERKDLWPGQVVLVDVGVGGYDVDLGWDPASKKPFPLVAPAAANPQEQADASQDQEELSESTAWQTIGFHGAAVADEVERIAIGMVPEAMVRILRLAGRWHDLGKAHAAFQGAIHGPERPPRSDLAKAPKTAWRKGRDMYRMSPTEVRRGFRHELASVLALFAVLTRHARPDHPSRLGDLASTFAASGASEGSAPGPLEAEILALSPDEFDLLAYLVCSHHGKLRSRLHGTPSDQTAPLGRGMPIRGIYNGDRLPDIELVDAQGNRRPLVSVELDLEPATLGLSPITGRSWTERVDHLLREEGPFAVAWLEALLRAADVRASKDARLVDPALTVTT